MRLKSARITNYRSIIDTGEFEVERLKTILVGPNEAGKSAILQALQQLNPPKGVKTFEALRDYPRSKYSDIKMGKVQPSGVTVVRGTFLLEDDDKAAIPLPFRECTYTFARRLDNSTLHYLNGGPDTPILSDVYKDLKRLSAHVAARVQGEDKPPATIEALVETWPEDTPIAKEKAKELKAWLDQVYVLVDEKNEAEEARYARLVELCDLSEKRGAALTTLRNRLPVFVLYSNYFRVRPNLHLEKFAARIAAGTLDDTQFDYGNACLLKLLGFSAKELSELGQDAPMKSDNAEALEAFRKKKDERGYALNAASVRLTEEIKHIWNPDGTKGEAAKLVLKADGQYLKAVVEDSLGVEIELDQRSEGLQWLVSFFIVFFAEAQDGNENAILLLDEPGVSLHALKQREFRSTLSRLSEHNQTLYTTHSPFLVSPDELDLVRVVELPDRPTGTKVHTTITAEDPAAILPLQEALGYDMAQSLFSQKKNLILEGLTDYWYLEAAAALLRDAKLADLDEKIALIPANSAGKVVYFATILHAQSFKVAALLDSDAAGENAAKQDTLVHTLGQKRILRTKDFCSNAVSSCEIEDLLRQTLVQIAKADLGIDAEDASKKQPSRPIVDLLASLGKGFSKYRLAKAFVKWSRDHSANDLTKTERDDLSKLIEAVNKAVK